MRGSQVGVGTGCHVSKQLDIAARLMTRVLVASQIVTRPTLWPRYGAICIMQQLLQALLSSGGSSSSSDSLETSMHLV